MVNDMSPPKESISEIENDVLPERGGSGFPALGSGRLFSSASSPRTEPRGIRGFENKLRLKHQKLFEKYFLTYDTLPSHKKILSSMIKFRDMYRPLLKRPGYPTPFIDIEGINAERKLQRAQIFLNKRDLITTRDDVHGKRLVVTSRGHKIFYGDYPLAKLREKPWDRVWTVIMYDFPEKERVERNAIRRRLMKLGFGSPQISILISPLPIEDPVRKLLEGENVAEQVWTLRAERILGMENEEIARKAWPIIDELNLLYGELLEVLPEVKKNKRLREQWGEYFLAVNDADPYLPFEILPKGWKGGKCEQEFVKLGPGGFFKTILKNLK